MPFSDEQFAKTASCFKLAFQGPLGSNFHHQKALEEAIKWAQLPDQHLVTPESCYYPSALLALVDYPQVLFAKGNPDTLQMPAVAIVGSRLASPQGEKIAREFSKVFSLSGLTVVSGLARGIDAAAHSGALEAKESKMATIAVVGHGIDQAYPKSNRCLKDAISVQGCVLSELPLGAPPIPSNFPRRNRLIAALSQGLWVVEAALKSGSLITARLALELGRDVFATPGSIFSEQSKGCHWLLRQGAKLVDCPQDILEEMLPLTKNGAQIGKKLPFNVVQNALPFEEDPLTLIGWASWWPDQLADHLRLSSAELSALLLHWELDGSVARRPDGQICRV
jgi:DNA processing protein